MKGAPACDRLAYRATTTVTDDRLVATIDTRISPHAERTRPTMPAARQTPALIQLADEFDLFYTNVCRVVRPLAPQVDPHQWQTIQTQAQDYQQRLEAMAEAASIAQSLLATGLPRSRHARAYRKLAAAVRS